MAFSIFDEKIVSPKHLANLHKKADTGRALAAAALADTTLGNAIKSKMIRISKDVEDRIFGGTGPLSNFHLKLILHMLSE